MNKYISALCEYALETGLILPEDKTWAINSILQVLALDEYTETAPA